MKSFPIFHSFYVMVWSNYNSRRVRWPRKVFERFWKAFTSRKLESRNNNANETSKCDTCNAQSVSGHVGTTTIQQAKIKRNFRTNICMLDTTLFSSYSSFRVLIVDYISPEKLLQATTSSFNTNVYTSCHGFSTRLNWPGLKRICRWFQSTCWQSVETLSTFTVTFYYKLRTLKERTQVWSWS